MDRVAGKLRDEPILLREAALPGALAGLFASGVMAAVWMLLAYSQGDAWRPIKLIAATVMGEAAAGGAGFQPLPVVAGLAIHFAFGTALGIFFAWLGGFLNIGAAMAWGFVFGLAIWVIMQFGLLPVLNPSMAALSPIPFAVSHALFGLSLGTYPRFLPRQAVTIQQVWRKAA